MHHLRRYLAAAIGAAVLASGPGITLAAYTDVPPGVWYRPAVDAFLSSGYLDAGQTTFRASDTANRAELVTLIRRMDGGDMPSPTGDVFDDVPSSAWFAAAMEGAARDGWVMGDGNCVGNHPCFARPATAVNRAEAAALIVRAFSLQPTWEAPRFPDNVNGQWYNTVIQTAVDHCILQGDPGNRRVRPAGLMNRAEMVVMLQRASQGLRYGEDCRADQLTEAEIEDARAVSDRGVEVDFTVDLDPARAERHSHYTLRSGGRDLDIDDVTLIDDRAVLVETDEDLLAGERYVLGVRDLPTRDGRTITGARSFDGFTEPLEEEGALTVSVSADNPAAAAVPRGGQTAVLSLRLAASCGEDVSIGHLTVSHRGFGLQADIEGLYAMVDGERRTRLRTVRSDGATDLRFSPALVIPACRDAHVDVMAVFDQDALVASEHAFDILGVSDIAANVTDVRGQFPLRGNTMRIAPVAAGTLTFAYRTVAKNEVNIGETDAVVARFQLSADGREDHVVRSLSLEQDGSASDGDLTNLRIRRSDGTVLTPAVDRLRGDRATFVFDPPLRVRRGDRMSFEVVADIKGGAARTVRLTLEEPADLIAVGSAYGSAAAGRIIGSRVSIDTATAADTISIGAGRLTVEIDGPASRAYTRDDDDAVLANVRFAIGGDPVEIRSLYLAVVGETSTGAGLAVSGDAGADEIREMLTGVRLRNAETGRSIAAVRLTGSNDAGSDASRTYQIYRIDDVTVRGTETWRLEVDFQDNGPGRHPRKADRFAVRVCAEPTHVQDGAAVIANASGCEFGGVLASPSTAYQLRAEGLSTGDRVADVRPRGTVSGVFHRIAAPELIVAVRETGASDTTVRGAKDVSLLRFEARAGEAKDILLTQMIFDAASGSLLNAQNYSLWADSDDDGTADLALERGVAARGGTVTFSRLTGGGYLLEGDRTAILEVRADIATSPAGDRIQLRFATGRADYLSAEEADRGSPLSGVQTDDSCPTTEPCDIIVRTAASKLWRIVNQGNLYVTRASTPVGSRQLLGGTLTDPVLRLQLRADNEPIAVTDLQITSSGSTAQSVDRLELFLPGAEQPLGSATIGACGGSDTLTSWQGADVRTFCASMRSQQLVVQPGQTVDLIVRARIKTDDEGGISGETVRFFLTGQAVADAATGSGAVRGYGLRSGNQLGANDADAAATGEVFIGAAGIGPNSDIVGNPHDVVMSRIPSVVNANPDANGMSVPVGTTPFGQFRFTAAVNANTRGGSNRATLSGVIFSVNATNVGMDAGRFRIYNKADASVKHACQAVLPDSSPVTGTASGTFLVACTGLVDASVNTEIGSGASQTFVLEGLVTDPSLRPGSVSTLQASLQAFTSRPEAQNGFGVASSHIHWQDLDQSASDFYWIDLPDTTVHSTSYRN